MNAACTSPSLPVAKQLPRDVAPACGLPGLFSHSLQMRLRCIADDLAAKAEAFRENARKYAAPNARARDLQHAEQQAADARELLRFLAAAERRASRNAIPDLNPKPL